MRRVCAPGASISSAATDFSSAPSSGSRSWRKRGPGPSRSKACATDSNRSPRTSGAGGANQRSSHSSSFSGAAAVASSPIRNSCADPLKSGRGHAKATKGSSSIPSTIRNGATCSTCPLRRRSSSQGARIKFSVLLDAVTVGGIPESQCRPQPGLATSTASGEPGNTFLGWSLAWFKFLHAIVPIIWQVPSTLLHLLHLVENVKSLVLGSCPAPGSSAVRRRNRSKLWDCIDRNQVLIPSATERPPLTL